MEVLVTEKRQEREDQGPKQRRWAGARLGKEGKWERSRGLRVHKSQCIIICGSDPKKTEGKTLATALSCESGNALTTATLGLRPELRYPNQQTSLSGHHRRAYVYYKVLVSQS